MVSPYVLVFRFVLKISLENVLNTFDLRMGSFDLAHRMGCGVRKLFSVVLILDATDLVGSRIFAAIFDLLLRRRCPVTGVVTGGAFSFFGFVGVPEHFFLTDCQ